MNWISVGKEKRVDPNSTTYTNFKTKQIINFNVKHETIKLTHKHPLINMYIPLTPHQHTFCASWVWPNGSRAKPLLRNK